MTSMLKVTIGLGVGIGVLVAILLIMAQGAQVAAPGPGIDIPFDRDLAQEGKQLFTSRYACIVCHSISSVGIGGTAVGPDLSRALLAKVPSGLNPLERWFEERGLARPEEDPERAADLLVEFLSAPPDYSPTMKGMVAQFKSRAGGDEAWLRDVKAMVELFKQAAAE